MIYEEKQTSSGVAKAALATAIPAAAVSLGNAMAGCNGQNRRESRQGGLGPRPVYDG